MFGDRLKELRESQSLTQTDLALYLNVSRQSVGGYENNTTEPGIDILVKIADRFNVSLDYLLCRTDEKENFNLMNSINKELLFKVYEIINSYKILEK